MDLRDSVAIALASQEPRRSAEIALGQLTTHLRAAGAALFRIVGGKEIVLLCGYGVDQKDLDRATATWDDAGESMLAGNPYTEGQFALIPLERPPVGILYIGARRTFRVSADALQAVRRLEPLLLLSLQDPQQTGPSPVEEYLEATPLQEVEREQLAILLRRNDWNISRVARILRVSRVTIYARMARLKLGIVRPQNGKA